ncbi:MAG TPA: shikimate dehydrogenase [Pyrinomonadaceae bacterium]|nr:shikimate dehydrogenase [Pyrinomonadaceae bacterium]
MAEERNEHRLALSLMKTNEVRICVPVCVERASELAGAVKRAAEVADIIELRLDYLSETVLAQSYKEIWAALASRRRPMILTLRPAEYGGRRALSVEDRLLCWLKNSWWQKEPRADFCDLELDLAVSLPRQSEGFDVVLSGKCDWTRIICSHHDFVGVSSDLEKIYERMAATPAHVLKIAVQADDALDCLPVFRLLDRARREGREMIAIAMGQAGIMTRILGPSRGAFLTYGSLDDESATAPGQLTARELREIYRIDQINQQTEIIGLIGRPVSHSVSPHIHNAAFAASEVNAVYIPFEVGDAAQFMSRMIHPRSREMDWNLRGLSVTAPHKRAVMNCLDWVEPAAKEIGAVNTIVVEDNELHGYNTDTLGFISPLREKYGALNGARCAIIGAGGAARAALSGLRNENGQPTLFARDVLKAKPVAEEFGVECRPLAGARFDGFDILVNATSLGTRGEHENATPATAEQLRGVRLAYDLVYNPIETRFLREAQIAGCETIAGIEMLIAQAIEQFKLWTGKQPDVEIMRRAAMKALSPESNIQHLTSNI